MKQAEFKRFHEKYLELRPRFDDLRIEAAHTLKQAISQCWIKVHSITGRIKDFDSCVKKVADKKIKEPFKEIKDFVGLRVVCLFPSDLDRVETVIHQTFIVVEREDKTTNRKENVFGYMGRHFIVKLKADKKTNDMLFEIQVRTIAQDAWDSVSHELDYKTNSIPEGLERDFYALSALFYVADTHLSFIKQDTM